MHISYLMIACSSGSLAVGLNAISRNSFIQINLHDAPQVTYLGLRHRGDFALVEKFAKRNGYAFQELSEMNMRDLQLRLGTFLVEGDDSLASWLNE